MFADASGVAYAWEGYNYAHKNYYEGVVDAHSVIATEQDGKDPLFENFSIHAVPLISKYRSDEKYADAGMQDDVCQLAWADSVLSSAREDWVVVMDHHPVYAHTYHPAQASCRDVRVWTYSQFPALEGEGQRCGLCGEFCGFPVARAGGGGGHRVL